MNIFNVEAPREESNVFEHISIEGRRIISLIVLGGREVEGVCEAVA